MCHARQLTRVQVGAETRWISHQLQSFQQSRSPHRSARRGRRRFRQSGRWSAESSRRVSRRARRPTYCYSGVRERIAIHRVDANSRIGTISEGTSTPFWICDTLISCYTPVHSKQHYVPRRDRRPDYARRTADIRWIRLRIVSIGVMPRCDRSDRHHHGCWTSSSCTNHVEDGNRPRYVGIGPIATSAEPPIRIFFSSSYESLFCSVSSITPVVRTDMCLIAESVLFRLLLLLNREASSHSYH
jgi:hypothetical protein